MEKDHYVALAVLLGIIAIAAFGGFKNAQNINGFGSTATQQETKEQKIADTQKQIDDLQKQVQALQDAKNNSKYKGLVSIQYVNHSNDANSEYLTLSVQYNATTSIPITGWQLKSLSSGNSVTIPFGTQLYFTGTTNLQDNIILYPGDNVYVITGVSPNGYSFRINECSGYLTQFQAFTPYISTNCPAPRNENLSSIPNRLENDACFDFINSYQSCHTQTDPLPISFSYECKNFITQKLNYSSCVDTHKNDSDFYQKDWRIYLKRSNILWKNQREDIVLYDADGKIVSELKY